MTDAPPTPTDDLPEQMQVRLEKRQRLLDSGRRPTRSPSSAPTRSSEIREKYDARLEAGELEPDTRTGEQVAITGRVIFQRNTGKLCFARLREGTGPRSR